MGTNASSPLKEDKENNHNEKLARKDNLLKLQLSLSLPSAHVKKTRLIARSARSSYCEFVDLPEVDISEIELHENIGWGATGNIDHHLFIINQQPNSNHIYQGL